jgi:putative transposase
MNGPAAPTEQRKNHAPERPRDLEVSIGRFVDHYDHHRYHESLKNLAPADVYFGHAPTILLQRERVKRNTIRNRRLLHRKKAA